MIEEVDLGGAVTPVGLQPVRNESFLAALQNGRDVFRRLLVGLPAAELVHPVEIPADLVLGVGKAVVLAGVVPSPESCGER